MRFQKGQRVIHHMNVQFGEKTNRAPRSCEAKIISLTEKSALLQLPNGFKKYCKLSSIEAIEEKIEGEYR